MLLRTISGLVTVLTVLGLFSYGVIAMSNQVRYEQYWTNTIGPALRYISADHGLLVKESLPFLSVVAKDQEKFSSVFQARIAAGQVVVDADNFALNAWVDLDDALLLEMESSISGTQVFDLYAWILASKLAALDAGEADFDAELQRLAVSLGIEVRKIVNPELLSSQMILEGLAERDYYTVIRDNAISGLFRAPNGEIYELDYGKPFQHVSWFVVIFLAAAAISLLAMLGFYLFQTLDRRLRSIETVASRIARGELDARVKRSAGDDAISRLGIAFNSMADHIQRLMYVQKEMIHAVSHELRTPVARIRFGVQMIEDCPSQEALQKQVRGIDGDIQELDELIDEILTYARLEQGGPILAFQQADISEIVEQVITEQSSTKPDMEIFSEYSKGSDAWKMSEVEARYIHRSIQNLVGNATRYAKGKVRVKCAFDQETCRVDVEDDGPGIPEDQWESVFTPFARLDDSRTRSSGGYGLGLSIVRRILFWHGGQAFLGRSDLGGAKFSLVWPRKQSQ